MNRIYVDEDSLTDVSYISNDADLSLSKLIHQLKPAYALREAWREGYTKTQLQADILAGLVVGIVALPLAMALAIASGVPPQYGLYTAIIAGATIAALGGSRTQVSGPTAAFVVVLAPIATKFGLGGLVLASLLAGIILVVFGLVRLGKFIEYIPYPVTTGFTSGIAVVIAILQLKDFFGLTVPNMPEHFPERVLALAFALPTARVGDMVIGSITLALLLFWPRITTKIPAPLAALTIAAVLTWLLTHYLTGFSVTTIGSRFSYTVDGVVHMGIPRRPPIPLLPWHLPGANGQPLGLSLNLVRQLLPSAFAIAILGAIESLLSAVVADGRLNTKHDPDAELVAQGVGNILGPFFGGFAATGAIARTATNIRSGGRSPIAAIVHALFLLVAVLLLAPLLAYLPMTSMAALLLVVAWNMGEAKQFIHMLRIAPRSDVLVLLTCFSLTVLFDMVIGVSVGLVLSSLLFMHWMAITSKVRVIEEQHPTLREPLPPQTILYEISGPLFFGAAQKAMSTLEAISEKTRTVILYIGSVQVVDATGLFHLEAVLNSLKSHGVFVIIAGVRAQPAKALVHAGIQQQAGQLAICKSWKTSLRLAREYSAGLIPQTEAEE